MDACQRKAKFSDHHPVRDTREQAATNWTDKP
jgi:hypothetical protein